MAKTNATRSKDSRVVALHELGILDTPPEPEFDDLAVLASQICGTPAALISLVDSDRQWFKAKIGFDPTQTPLSQSVCAHALSCHDLLIIRDLTLDDRTKANSLVTGEPHLRFYAGAPLITNHGDVLGTLCVLDRVPRPEGLTDIQTQTLSVLARQVVSAIEARRAMADTIDAADRLLKVESALRTSEAKWRGLFESLAEGFVLAQVVRGASGTVIDWRYEEVNRSWHDLTGLPVGSVVGNTVRELIPGVEQEWIDLASVVDSQEPMRFTWEVGALNRWYDGYAQSIGGDRFTIILVEVTDRIERERRQAAMIDLGDRLRDLRDVASVARAAAECVTVGLAASRTGFGTVDPEKETVDVPADWCADGMSSVAGLHHFRTFGTYIENLKGGETVLIQDVREDLRTKDGAAAFDAIQTRSLLNLPIMEKGELSLIVFVHHHEPRDWTDEENDFVRQAGDRTQAEIARIRAEEQQRILNEELHHRLKNTFAVVQAIAGQTLRGVGDRQAVEAFGKRLAALSSAHDVLLQQSWSAASMREVAHGVLANVTDTARIELRGPKLAIGPRATLSLSLLLHELGTNALKYGALSNEKGRILIDWKIERSENATVVVRWQEEGGPSVEAPSGRGFGSRLIRLGMIGTGDVDLRYDPKGFSAEMRAPLSQMQLA